MNTLPLIKSLFLSLVLCLVSFVFVQKTSANPQNVDTGLCERFLEERDVIRGWLIYDEKLKENVFLDDLGRTLRFKAFRGDSVSSIDVTDLTPVEITGTVEGDRISAKRVEIKDIYKGNPLLKKSIHPFEAIPFNEINLRDFLPAVRFALDKARLNIRRIESIDLDKANFQNTIVALEEADALLSSVLTINELYKDLATSEEFQVVRKEISDLTSPFYTELMFNKALFDRVDMVYKNEVVSGTALNTTQKNLVKKYRQGFQDNGLELSDESQQRLKEINIRLSELSDKFNSNETDSSDSFKLVITDNNIFDGFPDYIVEGYKEAAVKAGAPEAWSVSLDYPSYAPFMMYCKDSGLRKKLWLAYAGVASSGEFDNRKNVLEQVKLRHEKAVLLGNKNHASLVLKNKMAKSPEKVAVFLEEIREATYSGTQQDIELLKRFRAETEGSGEVFKPWDLVYYERLYKEANFSFNPDELKPYFELNAVLEGLFLHLEKLFGITFKERSDIPIFHKDQKVFEVFSRNKEHLGLVYYDAHPRDGKAGGAWAAGVKTGHIENSKRLDKHVFITTNYALPTASTPSLLSFSDVETLFHEFGHGVHTLLSLVDYPSFAGTAVKRDFVEFPSQLMENWVSQEEVLNTFARHYKTGEPLPKELLKKLKSSEVFMNNNFYLRQASLAWLDLVWTTIDPDKVNSVEDLEAQAWENFSVLPIEEGSLMSSRFSHIFGGGYDAGYYSYLWAEVIDADAFSEFAKPGNLYNPELARKLVDHILSQGGSENPLKLYKRFLNRDPDPEALIRRIRGENKPD